MQTMGRGSTVTKPMDLEPGDILEMDMGEGHYGAGRIGHSKREPHPPAVEAGDARDGAQARNLYGLRAAARHRRRAAASATTGEPGARERPRP
jgi:hypothetical protein